MLTTTLAGNKLPLTPAMAAAVPFTLAERYKNIRTGLWVYFILLIIEGGLRKWIFPSLATPLLIIRDPVAIVIFFMALQKGILQSNGFVLTMFVVTVLAFMLALMLGHGNFFVALYGARIYVLHWPLIFIMGKVFNREDVKQFGRVTLMIAIPMALLIAAQFYSPQTAWVNRAVGGEGGAGFAGALGYLRPPGTFSFTNGTTMFFSFVAPFVVYFWFDLKSVRKPILIAATTALLAAIPLSISRGLFFQVVLTVVFMLLGSVSKPRNIGKLIVIIIAGIITLLFLSKMSFFETATKAFTSRFEGANKAEGGLVDGVVGKRYLGGIARGVNKALDQPFWGRGLGLGTSVGGTLVLGKAGLQLGEDEWSRMLGEMGILLGFIVIIIRVSTAMLLVKHSWKRAARGDLLAWLVTSFAFLSVIQAQWGQPTNLGFAIMIGGLGFAALRTDP